ncbi:MAG TPA: desulfoferrodoxin [Thermotogota bacterium]|nr:desulfoferrodoxin [Thermotogota bacterium]HRW91682.1 desulfoferrodoxin [Thermotogota bacterium]
MTKRNQVYKCSLCGNIVEVLHEGKGQLVCCGEPMELLEEKTAEQANEKHVPVVHQLENGIKVVVGSTVHPMLENHFIEWIEVLDGKGVYRKHLQPGDAPECIFENVGDIVQVREHCNVHGLWVYNV